MSFDARNITQGGQVIKYMIGMFIQITNIVVYYSILPAFVAFFGWIFYAMQWVQIKCGIMYAWVYYFVAKLPKPKLDQIYYFTWVKGDQSYRLSRTYAQILEDPFFIKSFSLLKHNAFIGWGISLLVFLLIIMGVMWYLGKKGSLQRKNDQIGGRYLSTVENVNRMLKRAKLASHLTIGDLHLVKNSEVQNFGLHGTVGTGKSTVIRRLLYLARQDGKRGVVYDKGNTFIPIFFREGKDIILNPMDSRCPNWDLWTECRDRADLENFAVPLLPESGKGGDPFWVLASRMLFVSTAEAMRQDPNRSIKKLLNNLLSVSMNDLRGILENTDASNLVEGSIEKTAVTIRTVLATYAKALRICQGLDGEGSAKFSIRDWLFNSEDDAWIFLSSDGRVHESIKPLITAWLNVIMQNVLALTPDLNRRVWTILDELPSLHNLPLILEYLSEARKHGGASLVGIQNFPQLEENYGRDKARAIWDLLNTKAFFRSPSADVAKWVQEEIGEIRHNKFRDQYSYGVDAIRDGVNFSKEEVSEEIVSYSDIQRLDDLQCYITLKGDYPVVKVKLQHINYPEIAIGKIERDMSAVFDSSIEQKIEELSGSSKIDELGAILASRSTQSMATDEQADSGAESVTETTESEETASESNAEQPQSSEASGSEVNAPPPPELTPDGVQAVLENTEEKEKAPQAVEKNENGSVNNNLKHQEEKNPVRKDEMEGVDF